VTAQDGVLEPKATEAKAAYIRKLTKVGLHLPLEKVGVTEAMASIGASTGTKETVGTCSNV